MLVSLEAEGDSPPFENESILVGVPLLLVLLALLALLALLTPFLPLHPLLVQSDAEKKLYRMLIDADQGHLFEDWYW